MIYCLHVAELGLAVGVWEFELKVKGHKKLNLQYFRPYNFSSISTIATLHSDSQMVTTCHSLYNVLLQSGPDLYFISARRYFPVETCCAVETSIFAVVNSCFWVEIMFELFEPQSLYTFLPHDRSQNQTFVDNSAGNYG